MLEEYLFMVLSRIIIRVLTKMGEAETNNLCLYYDSYQVLYFFYFMFLSKHNMIRSDSRVCKILYLFTLSAKKMDRVMETLSESNATVQAFKVQGSSQIQGAQSTSQMQDILDYVRDRVHHPAQFLVVCSLDTTQEILKQVNLSSWLFEVWAVQSGAGSLYYYK